VLFVNFKSPKERERESVRHPPPIHFVFVSFHVGKKRKKVKVEVEIKDLLDSCWGNMKKNNVGWNQKTRPAKVFFSFQVRYKPGAINWSDPSVTRNFFFSIVISGGGWVVLCVFFSFFVVNHRWDEEDKKEKNNTREDADRRV
jgi:hypothetical protein